MAGAAVTETLDEITTAIPLRVVCGVGRQWAGLEVERLPEGDGRARHEHAVLRNLRAHRIVRHEIGEHRVGVLLGDPREMIVRKSGIELAAVAPDP
jgi:hypothetical protein